MKNRQLGLIVALVGILLLVLIVSLVPVIQDAQMAGCVCSDSGEGGICPHQNNLPYQLYLGGGIAIVMFFLSYSLITKKELSGKKIEIPRDLNEEERSVIDAIIKEKGLIFQSDLAEKLKLSKVKVTRILDKLEARGLIERRRRGMTNAVILKHK